MQGHEIWNKLDSLLHSNNPVSKLRQNRDFLMQTAKNYKLDNIADYSQSSTKKNFVKNLVDAARSNNRSLVNNLDDSSFTNIKSGLYHEQTLSKMLSYLKKDQTLSSSSHMMIAAGDLDNFKAFNDTYGSTEADRAIGMYGRLLESIRSENQLNRLRIFQPTRGDEFVVVGLSGKDPKDVLKMKNEMSMLFDKFHIIKNRFDKQSLIGHPEPTELNLSTEQQKILDELKQSIPTEHPFTKIGLTVGISGVLPVKLDSSNELSFNVLNKRAEKIQKQVKVLGRGFASEEHFSQLSGPAKEFLGKITLLTDKRADKQEKTHFSLPNARKTIYFSKHFNEIRSKLPYVRIAYPHSSIRYRLGEFANKLVSHPHSAFSSKHL